MVLKFQFMILITLQIYFYSGRPNTASKSFGVFTGVFNVPNNVSRLRFMFETFEKRSYESANGGRILKGKNNFGGSD